MTTRTKMILVTIVGTLILLTLHPVGPLGSLLWPQPAEGAAQPEGVQLPLFLVLFVSEAAVSAFGVAFLFFGWATTRRALPADRSFAMAVHVSIAYLLIQWWPHGNLHMSVPFSFGSILAIDYAFHIPIMIASITILTAVVRVARARTGAMPAGGA